MIRRFGGKEQAVGGQGNVCRARPHIAASELRPENLTNATHPAIHTVCGVKEGAQHSVIVCRETCGANGKFSNVGFRGDGDGLWLETPEGVRIADAKILSFDATRIDFVFETDVPSGKYRFVAGLSGCWRSPMPIM